MTKNFKTVFLFTMLVFFCLIILKIITKHDFDGWYSGAIMYFFSFSLLQTSLLEKNNNQPQQFVKLYGFSTILKLLISVLFIIIYATTTIPSVYFFVWFLVLYLIYTILLGFLFYKKT